MKALEKDRARRYETASGLAPDCSATSPASRSWRRRRARPTALRKFVRSPPRRGDRGDAGRLRLDRRARRHAVAGTRCRPSSVTRRARRPRAPPRSTTSWNRCWRRRIRRPQGERDVTVFDLLDKASASAGKTLAGQPEAEAEARAVLGKTFISLGEFDRDRGARARGGAARARSGARLGVAGTSLQALARRYATPTTSSRRYPLPASREILDAKGDDSLGERAMVHS